MGENQPVFSREYQVSDYLEDQDSGFDLRGLLNILQNSAWAHATILGHGFERMAEHQAIWALTRQRLILQGWPNPKDQILVKTWVRPVQGAFATRDYEFWLSDDRKLGESTTSWLTLDSMTRRPIRIPFTANAEIFRQEGLLSLSTQKIPLRNDLQPAGQIHVELHDLDQNGHVNNTRYAGWVTQALFPNVAPPLRLREYEVNFLSETNFQDRIDLYAGAISSSPERPVFQVQGLRISDQKIVFSARIEGDLV